MQFIGSSGDQEDVVNAAVRAATDYIAEALVLVRADPTADITATRAIDGVWIAGERVR